MVPYRTVARSGEYGTLQGFLAPGFLAPGFLHCVSWRLVFALCFVAPAFFAPAMAARGR